MPSFLLNVILLFSNPDICSADVRVRKVEVKHDQIVTVKTSVGIATIIQVPDRPNSLVVGNPSGFKVEYLDQAITIKPNYSGARSNLYIYTDYRRFNIQLVTTAESVADYVVYLENPNEKLKSSPIKWTQFRNHLKNESLIFETKRFAKMRDGMLIIEFQVLSEASETFKPEWLWLTQKGVTRPIHNIALTGSKLKPNETIHGVMQVLREDISSSDSLKIELRRKKSTFLTIPKVSSWK
ncbi:MAG: TrbG/VirB9 family P-type conjugative transfer protein [Bdellovibrionales bacterium]|nr:TrbG/VirB9 family P-type conjugative transfer protein [Bdellovibrionales bacterium]